MYRGPWVMRCRLWVLTVGRLPWGRDTWESSVPAPPFCCDPKTVLKISLKSQRGSHLSRAAPNSLRRSDAATGAARAAGHAEGQEPPGRARSCDCDYCAWRGQLAAAVSTHLAHWETTLVAAGHAAKDPPWRLQTCSMGCGPRATSKTVT